MINIQYYFDKFDRLDIRLTESSRLSKEDIKQFLKESLESAYQQGAIDAVNKFPDGVWTNGNAEVDINELKAKFTKINN